MLNDDSWTHWLMKKLGLHPRPKRSRSRVRRVRPQVEQLESRDCPSQLLWTDATGDGMWNTAGNWYDTVYHTSAVPGSSDYALFEPGLAGVGSAADCTVNGNVSVDCIIMDSSYTGTLAIPNGVTLATRNYFEQYGILDLFGNATVNVGTNAYINGTVTTGLGPPGGPPALATLEANGPMWIYPNAVIATASAIMGPGSTSLLVSAANMDDFGTITVGTPEAYGKLTISGSIIEESGASIGVFGGSVLTFTTGGSTGAHADLKGALNLSTAGPGGGATVANAAEELWIGGTLTSLGADFGGNTITGDVTVVGGTMNVGTTTMASTLNLTGGSLTIGALSPSMAGGSGTLNVYAGSTLAFPAAAGLSSTFVVKGAGVGDPAQINLYGGTITMAAGRVADLDLEAGLLNSYSDADLIVGSLLNNGTVQFGGALHALHVTGGYTQDQTGTLVIRLDNGGGGGFSPSDVLAIGGAAVLDGVLDLIAQHSLNPLQTWEVLTAGAGIAGDFSLVEFPQDGNPNWREFIPIGAVPPQVDIQNF
jgi:hypothetical protein